MEIKKRAKIKSVPYKDFKDNETYEKLVAELNAGGVNVLVKPLDATVRVRPMLFLCAAPSQPRWHLC